MKELFSIAAHLLMMLSTATVVSSSSASLGRSSDSKASHVKLAGIGPDPFVVAAPLVVGACCIDGVLLVALHTSFEKEPLLLSPEAGDSESKSFHIPDLPRQYRGPFRICSVGNVGALACAGWRADAQILTQYCRSVASDEQRLLGDIPSIDAGHTIASAASNWMARRAASEGARALSCVGLVATSTEGGFLWLVDATGAYRVRAHAVGNGLLAGKVNDALSCMHCGTKLCEDVCKELLEVIGNEKELPRSTRVEIAQVGPSPHIDRLQRLFVQTSTCE